MSLIPAGDMANALFLRRQSALLKSELARHSQELSTGRTADPLRKLRGDTAALAAVERGRTALDAYDMATKEAALHTAGQQRVLEKLRVESLDLAGELLTYGNAVPPEMIQTGGRIGRAAFEDAVAGLNTQMGGRSLFSGVASDRPALAPVQEIVDALMAAVAGATTAEEVEQIVTDWFDPAGTEFLSVAYRGATDPEGPVSLSPGQRVEMSVTAARPELRKLLGGLAMISLVEAGALGDNRAERAKLIGLSAVRLLEAPGGVTALAGELGDTEARIETAKTRNAHERTALELALTDLIAVDSFDAATRLEETRVRIESLFTLTARLQRMSLTEFLR